MLVVDDGKGTSVWSVFGVDGEPTFFKKNDIFVFLMGTWSERVEREREKRKCDERRTKCAFPLIREDFSASLAFAEA